MTNPCVFCEIVAERSPAKVLTNWLYSHIIVPLNPVVDGHVIAISNRHLIDAMDITMITGMVMDEAAAWARQQALTNPKYVSVNFITSVGIPATQSINHLHIHIVPRAIGDGLMLPWTNQKV